MVGLVSRTRVQGFAPKEQFSVLPQALTPSTLYNLNPPGQFSVGSVMSIRELVLSILHQNHKESPYGIAPFFLLVAIRNMPELLCGIFCFISAHDRGRPDDEASVST